MASSFDHCLLFGTLALQMDLIDREQLVSATRIRLNDNSRELREILVEHGALTADDCQLLETLVTRHLENQDGEATSSLAALSGFDKVANELRSFDDDQVQTTLSIVDAVRAGESTVDTSMRHSQSITPSRLGNQENGERFRILRSHARGGLGEVYLARDTELNRHVALKEIQGRFADDESSRCRFLLEAEVTGGLEHPGIVPVYGLGRYRDGRPFYAMRFIEGDSLEEAANEFLSSTKNEKVGPTAEFEQKATVEENSNGKDKATAKEKHSSARTDYTGNGPNGADFNSLGFRKLLGRFIDVCQAIEYAHSRGVLHRDLKPGNIMLGKFGETLVVDWGLAKAQVQDGKGSGTADTLRPVSGGDQVATVMGKAIGTPAFMPPEQAAGKLEELGPASDVYSLGATLYYMLTGRPPVRGENLGDLLEGVRQGRILCPREANDQIPKALEAICLKAMALEPSARYSSSLELAEDVERFLADEPVSVYPEPALVRARRWIRNHQTLVVTTVAVLLLTAVGLSAFSTVLTQKNTRLAELVESLDQANTDLRQSNERESKSRRLAEANEKSAREQSALALATLSSVVADIQGSLKGLAGGGNLRRSLLKTALADLEKISAQHIEAAEVDRQTMLALFEIGELIFSLGDDSDEDQEPEATSTETSAIQLALSYFEKAQEIAEDLAISKPKDFTTQGDLAHACSFVADAQRGLGNSEEALRSLERSLALRLENAALWPESREAQRDLFMGYYDLGRIQKLYRKTGDALEALSYAKEICDQLHRDVPNDKYRQEDLVECRLALADALQQAGKADESYEVLREALDWAISLAAQSPDNIISRRRLSNTYLYFGYVAQQVGADNEALDAFQNGLKVAKAIVNDDSSDPKSQRSLANAYIRLGNFYRLTGDKVQSLEAYQKAMAGAEKLAEADIYDLRRQRFFMVTCNKVGDLLLASGRTEQAIDTYDRGFQVAIALGESDANLLTERDLMISYNKIGDALVSQNDAEQALVWYRRGLLVTENLVAEDSSNAEVLRDLSVSHFRLGVSYRSLGDYERALSEIEEAIGVLEQMIARGMRVQRCQQEISMLAGVAARTQTQMTAVGDWEELIQQPKESLPSLLELRAITLARQADFDGAVRAAKKLLALDSVDHALIYNAACIISLAAAKIEEEAEEALSDDQSTKRDRYIEDALSALRMAVESGWSDYNRIETDPDLLILRDQPGFADLLKSRD